MPFTVRLSPFAADDDDLTFLRPGERVQNRPLAIYQTIGDRLAAVAGGRS